MKRIDVVKKRNGWAGESGGRTVPNTKAEAIKRTAAAAKKDSEPVSVKIYKADGTFQEELSAFRRSQEEQRLGFVLAGARQSRQLQGCRSSPFRSCALTTVA